jgi:hypothetical protein
MYISRTIKTKRLFRLSIVFFSNVNLITFYHCLHKKKSIFFKNMNLFILLFQRIILISRYKLFVRKHNCGNRKHEKSVCKIAAFSKPPVRNGSVEAIWVFPLFAGKATIPKLKLIISAFCPKRRFRHFIRLISEGCGYLNTYEPIHRIWRILSIKLLFVFYNPIR